MMFRVHRAGKVRVGFVLGLLLPAAPVHKAAVAEAPEHPDDPHGFGQAHRALVIVVPNVQPLVQAAFNAPGRPILLEPLSGVGLRRR